MVQPLMPSDVVKSLQEIENDLHLKWKEASKLEVIINRKITYMPKGHGPNFSKEAG